MPVRPETFPSISSSYASIRVSWCGVGQKMGRTNSNKERPKPLRKRFSVRRVDGRRAGVRAPHRLAQRRAGLTSKNDPTQTSREQLCFNVAGHLKPMPRRRCEKRSDPSLVVISSVLFFLAQVGRIDSSAIDCDRIGDRGRSDRRASIPVSDSCDP